MTDYNRPLVSVILPAYNAEKYIKESIESVIYQTLKSVEVICIDDASTDNTLSIMESICDSRIKIVRNAENLGLIKTRNLGYSLATGSYIANMDADDICNEFRLAKQLDFLLKNPEVDIVGCSINIISENGKITGKWSPPTTDSQIKAALIFEAALANPTVMMRQSVLKNNTKGAQLLSDGFTSVEDYESYSRLALEGFVFANLKGVLLDYRVVSTGMTKTYEDKAKFRDSVHNNVYRRNIDKLSAYKLDIGDVHRHLVTGNVLTIGQLERLSNYLSSLERSLIIDNKCLKKDTYERNN